MLVLVCAMVGCAQPTLLTCPPGQAPCDDGCADLATTATDCGGCGLACPSGMTCVAAGCVPDTSDLCATAGCSADAVCEVVAGAPVCTCDLGYTGDGFTCAACTACDLTQYPAAPCGPLMDTVCADCDPSCATCDGPGASCTSCLPGDVLMDGLCFSSFTCGDGLIDPGEDCDDGNPFDGDGCSSGCTVEAGYYCFDEGTSRCVAGSCVDEPATSLPLGSDFALDGSGTPTALGLLLTQRSTIHTTADVTYPIMVEADVTYSAPDITYIGARGSGLRQAADSDEPTDSLRARLSASAVELVAGTTVTDSTSTPFTPQSGVTYHIRYIDDGSVASVEWYDPADLSTGVAIATFATYHGGGDRAFVGGGDMAGVTVANVRVCSAPKLPVTSGLVARYSAIRSWTAIQDTQGLVSTWQDTSGAGNDLAVDGLNPAYVPGLVDGHGGLDFTGGARLATVPFPLTTNVTVFAVIVHNVPDQWGAIAHHGNRDNDWSMEQSGLSGSIDTLHWQTNNDNTNMDLTLVQGTAYVLTGRFAGNDRYFSAATFDGTAPVETSITDASHTITGGDKSLYVGTSDADEASNAYIGDLVYFDRALTDPERDQVIDYLRRLWRP